MSFAMSENRTVPASRGPGLRAMFPYAAVKTVPKNTLLITEGNRVADTVYLIESGKVKIFLSNANGKEIDLGVLGPGDFFGETELDLEPRSVSALTTEPCRLAVIPQAEFRRLILENPEFAMDLVLKLIARTRDLLKNVKSLALEDVTDRVARLLVEMAIEENGKLIINEKLSKRDIANRVGATREMASRVFKNLVESGFIEFQDKRITISKRMAGLLAAAGVVGLTFMFSTSGNPDAAATGQLAGMINTLPPSGAGVSSQAGSRIAGAPLTGRVAQIYVKAGESAGLPADRTERGGARWAEVQLLQPLADGATSARVVLDEGIVPGVGDIVEIELAGTWGDAGKKAPRASRVVAQNADALAKDFERRLLERDTGAATPGSVSRR